jgi:hypothetical protein
MNSEFSLQGCISSTVRNYYSSFGSDRSHTLGVTVFVTAVFSVTLLQLRY